MAGNGGVLVIFPAGEVSSWDLRTQRVIDPRWSDTAARLARAGGAAVLPVYVKGENSLPFHLLGFVHPRLRTVRLPQELLNKRGKTIEIASGRIFRPDRLLRCRAGGGNTVSPVENVFTGGT